jgi:transposase
MAATQVLSRGFTWRCWPTWHRTESYNSDPDLWDCKLRHRVEDAFCRLKDFRRIATRYDRLARNFLASVCLVAAIVWWIL